MRLGEFIDQLRNQVDSFEGMYRAGRLIEGVNKWPEEMEEEEWVEQFIARLGE